VVFRSGFVTAPEGKVDQENLPGPGPKKKKKRDKGGPAGGETVNGREKGKGG